MKDTENRGKKCVIIGAGETTQAELARLADERRKGCLLIAADGGYDMLEQEGILPDLVIGDFDSSTKFPEETAASIVCIRLPREKDDTDLMAAIRVGIEKGCKAFELFGVLGGARFEHSVGNMMAGLYLKNRGMDVTIYGRDETCVYLGGGENFLLPDTLPGGSYVSVLSLRDESRGIRIQNMKYNVENFTMTNDLVTGLSNETLTGSQGCISLEKGVLVIIYKECYTV